MLLGAKKGLSPRPVPRGPADLMLGAIASIGGAPGQVFRWANEKGFVVVTTVASRARLDEYLRVPPSCPPFPLDDFFLADLRTTMWRLLIMLARKVGLKHCNDAFKCLVITRAYRTWHA
jgi:hypothetical protein